MWGTYKMKNEYKYDAFISYRHREFDKAVASKLQTLLETYRLPKSVSSSKKDRIGRIFRDETELSSSGNLSSEIKTALGESRYLIIVCSKETKHSKWCLEEITYFKELNGGSTENILALLIEGEPSEVFPKELCQEEQLVIQDNGERQMEIIEVEPLAANITADSTKASLKLLKREFLRIAATMLDCSFDDLYQRNQRRATKRFIYALAAGLLLVTGISIYALINAGIISEQNKQLVESLQSIERQQLFQSIDYAESLLEEGDRLEAASILSEAYERFDKKHVEYEEFKNTIEPLMARTVYYEDYSTYFAFAEEQALAYAVFAQEDTKLVSVTLTGEVDIMDLATGKKDFEFSTNLMVDQAALLENYLVVSSYPSNIEIWDISTGAQVHALTVAELFIETMVYSKELEAILVICERENNYQETYYSIVDRSFIQEKEKELNLVSNDLYDLISVSPEGSYFVQYDFDAISVTTLGSEVKEQRLDIDLLENELITVSKITDDGYVYILTNQSDQLEHEYISRIRVYDLHEEREIYEAIISETFTDHIFPPNTYNGTVITSSSYAEESFVQLVFMEATAEIYDIYLGIENDPGSYFSPEFYIQYVSDQEILITTNLKNLAMQIVSLDLEQTFIKSTEELAVSTGITSFLTASSNGEWILTSYTNGHNHVYYAKGNDLVVAANHMPEDLYYTAVSGNLRVLSKEGEIIDAVNNTVISQIETGPDDYIVYDYSLMNQDGTKVLYWIRVEGGCKAFLWDVEEHRSIELANLPAIGESEYGLIADISWDLSYICYEQEESISIYDTEKQEVVAQSAFLNQASDIYMQEDGETMIAVSRENNFIYEVDTETGELKLLSTVGGIGKYSTQVEALNLEQERIILYDRWSYYVPNQVFVHSMITGEMLFDFSYLGTEPNVWIFSSDGTAAVSMNSENLEARFWQIPGFSELVEEVKAFSSEIELTQEEREKSGLILFDSF